MDKKWGLSNCVGLMRLTVSYSFQTPGPEGSMPRSRAKAVKARILWVKLSVLSDYMRLFGKKIIVL